MSLTDICFSKSRKTLICSTVDNFSIYRIDKGITNVKNYNASGIGHITSESDTNIVCISGIEGKPTDDKTVIVYALDNSKDGNTKDSHHISLNTGDQIVRNIKIHYPYLSIVTDNKVNVYDMQKSTIKSYLHTYSNYNGIFDVHGDIIVTRGLKAGEICIWKFKELDSVERFVVHNSKVENVVLSGDGQYIATASERGTLIRIFNVSDKQMFGEYRVRTYSSGDIYSIAFSNDNKYLACATSNGSIHIWDLVDKTKNSNSFFTYIPLIARTTYSSQQWSKTISGLDTAECVIVFDDSNNILMLTKNGYYYVIKCNCGDDEEFSEHSVQQLPVKK